MTPGKLIRTLSLFILPMLLVSPIVACNTYNVTITSSTKDDLEEARQMYLQMALPTVMVKAEGGLGSGVVFGDGSYVLTAAHVVSHEETVTDDQGVTHGTFVPEKAVIFKNEGLVPFTTGTTIVKIDYDLDLAVLKLAQVYPYAKAKFASSDPVLYQKCWASGHPHGITDPMITEGRVQDLWEDNFIVYSAPTTFGNSGGPIFVKEGDRWLVSSVVQRVVTEGMGVAVNHMGFGCLPSNVRSFVEGFLK